MRRMYACGQRCRADGEETQHVVLVYPWHEGVAPGLLPEGRHVSRDGVQVGMILFDLSSAGESVGALLGVVAQLVGCEV